MITPVTSVDGLKELEVNLQELGGKVAKRIATKAMRKAMQPVLAAVKAATPTRTGRLQRSFKIRVLKTKNKNIRRVGVMSGKKWFTGETFYAAFLEFGTKNIDAEHMLEYSIEEQQSEVIRQLEFNLWNEIQKELKKGQ